MDVLDALFHTAHDYPGGIGALAVRMDASPNVLNKKVNPNVDSHRALLSEAVRIQQITQDYRVLNAMAQTLGFVALRVDDAEDLGDMNLLDSFMAAAEAQGDIAKEFKKAYADGNIYANELADIKAATYNAIAQQLAVLAQIERLVR